MKPDVIRRFAATILLALAFQTAWAIDIHTAKSQGLVGEANTGYLAAIGAPSAEVKALINEVNEKQVQVRFYELAVQRTEPGHYYQDAGGNWKRK
jgi:uncharacterized protein YdbL (DUF1318 family)